MIGRQLHLSFVRNGPHHLVVHAKRAHNAALEQLGPEFTLPRTRVDQLHLETHAVATPHDRRFDYRVDIQLARNLRDGLLGILVAHGGGQRGHLQRPDLLQRSDQRFMHTSYEEFLVEIAGGIVERQHCQ